MSSLDQVFTLTSAIGLAGVGAIGLIATACANAFLPKHARWQDRFTFFWLVSTQQDDLKDYQRIAIVKAFDALIHFFFEGSFLYLSTFGRSVNTSTGFFADLWKEYTLADTRWGVSDPTVVSLEILTVFGAGSLCCYILTQVIKNDPSRHYWIIVLSTAELYGGWMTFCPEWLTGSPSLNTSNSFHLWVYLMVGPFPNIQLIGGLTQTYF
ncbi:Emopamil binding protein-domain-containing protein [Butyriboletus roseoflavus]|nr:Emopamil binding protein-domain-containing protein [Butyriboletus roseoflavus]